MVPDQSCLSISPAEGKGRIWRDPAWGRPGSHQRVLTRESRLPLFLWAFQKYVSVAGASVPVGYLWVEREQRGTEEKSNLLGRSPLQLRLEEFGGRAIFFLVNGTHPTALPLVPGSTHLSGLGRKTRLCNTNCTPGAKLRHMGVCKDCMSSAPGSRSVLLQMPRLFFSTANNLWFQNMWRLTKQSKGTRTGLPNCFSVIVMNSEWLWVYRKEKARKKYMRITQTNAVSWVSFPGFTIIL